MPIDQNDILRAGRAEMADNPNRYDGSEDLEALGTAAYLEESLDPDSDHDISDVADYIASEDDFDFGDFVEYKKNMGNDYSQFADPVGRVFDEVNDLQDRTEAMGGIYEALYEEAKAERDSAVTALEDILDDAESARTSSEWLDQSDPDDDTDQDVGSGGWTGFWSPGGSVWGGGGMYQSQMSGWNGMYQQQGLFGQSQSQAWGQDSLWNTDNDLWNDSWGENNNGSFGVNIDLDADETSDNEAEDDNTEETVDGSVDMSDNWNPDASFDYEAEQSTENVSQSFSFSGSGFEPSGSITMEQSAGGETQYLEASF